MYHLLMYVVGMSRFYTKSGLCPGEALNEEPENSRLYMNSDTII